jgi:replicative DNA helicase
MTEQSSATHEPRADGAEKAVLGISMLSSIAAEETVRTLRVADFYEPVHQAIYTAIERLVDERKPTDAVSVWSQIQANGDERVLRDGPVFLHELYSLAPAAAALPHHIGLVKEAGARREVLSLGLLSQTMAESKTSGTANAILETIRDRLDGITAKVVDSAIPTMADSLEAALAEIERVGQDGAIVGIPTGFPELDANLHGLRPGQMIMIAGRPAMGKALCLNTPLPTPTGWTTMGDVNVGDLVLAEDGTPTAVIAVTPVMENRPCYEVEFSDGTVIVADAEHLWVTTPARTRPGRRACGPAAAYRTATTPTATLLRPGTAVTAAPATVTTRDIAGSLLNADGTANHAVAATAALRLPTAQLPRDPYRVGRDLATGADPFAVIPSLYLRGSVTQRRALLTGVLQQAAGTPLAPTNEFTTGNRHLAQQVHELACTLGYVATVTDRGDPDTATVRMSAGPVPAGFPRWPGGFGARPGSGTVRAASRLIVRATAIESVPVRCIQVASPRHLYLAGRGMIPTHNSTVMLDFVRNAAFHHGKSVLVFSLEMSRMEMIMRCLSAQARVELTNLQTGKLSEDEWDRLGKAHQKISESLIGIDDSPGTTIADMRVKARGWQARYGLDMIAVDYLQLMNSHRKVESRQQEVSEISRNIKLLAKEFGVPIVALSQLNRGAEQRADKKPMLSDLRESGSLEQDSDVVMFVHREEVYNPEQRVGEADIIIAKHRAGPTGIIPVVAQLHYSRFVPAAFQGPAATSPPA